MADEQVQEENNESEERTIVVPGEKVPGSVRVNAFKKDGESYSEVYGLMTKRGEFAKVVPLKGAYIPIEGDYIVGIITDVKFGGCVVDVNSPYTAFLPTKREYNHRDVIFAKVDKVDEVKNIALFDEKKLFQGELLDVSPVKVPRIIGKKNSMINLVKEATGCLIFVGRNGRIWIKGEKYAKAAEAILKIEAEAHTSGLTERITEFLKVQ
ncbi:RNA-binding protein [Candidatus Micrarchaeota archaeon]|nr:RNA-binding protein [Candidatus Micrarchaeota archaeon]